MSVDWGSSPDLFKITDSMNTKLNTLTSDLKVIDRTFSAWSYKLNTFSNTVKCHDSLMMEFISKYSTEVIRTFFLTTSLLEVQDTVDQLIKLQEKSLVGLSDLPNFLTSQILSGLEGDRFLTKSLRLGLFNV